MHAKSLMSGSLWPYAAVCQAPLSKGFSRQEYLSRLPRNKILIHTTWMIPKYICQVKEAILKCWIPKNIIYIIFWISKNTGTENWLVIVRSWGRRREDLTPVFAWEISGGVIEFWWWVHNSMNFSKLRIGQQRVNFTIWKFKLKFFTVSVVTFLTLILSTGENGKEKFLPFFQFEKRCHLSLTYRYFGEQL